MSTTTDPVEVELTHDKTTKNTYRYAEVQDGGQPPIVRNVYVQKWVFGEEPPETITVEIHE